ncbi:MULTISPECIES: hypothetical protein [unclassified Microbacterium]|nr:hypothetical protein [Microbacterium sp. Au-Mic1]MCE4027807.1 hypothetical protein [Microbacterium sp. Au-Mic1]
MSRRGRRGNDRDYRTPWILREIYGAPVWAMIAFGVVIVGIGAFALLHR